MKKLLFSLAFVSVSLMSIAQVITPFTVRYNTTQKGGIVFLANTAAGCGAGTTLCQSKTCVQAHAEDPLTGVAVDNDFVATYVDVDNDPSTWMSSSDSLNLPSCSTISFAGLFWGAGGSTSSSTDPDGVHWATRTHVKIKLNNGNYQDLTADYSQDNTTGYHSYHCYKNITNIVAAAGANGRYTLANMPLLNDNGTTKNRWGGWQIVIVYKNELQTLRNLTVFNGLANVSGTTATNIPISGFLTPLTGPVNFELGVLAYDGDRGYNTGSGTSNSSCATTYRGDSLKFKGATSFVAITDLIHPSNDVFNSTISYNGVLTPFRNPSYSNTLGHDANIFVPNNSAKNYIGNSATSATIRETTGGETILSQVITSAIDVYEPDLHGSLAVRDLNGGAVQPGDTLEYIMTVANYGSDPSIHTYLTDTLGVNAVYVPNSIRISYGPNIGNKTDASGDDQVDYFSVSNAIRVRVGTTASSTIGGTVVNSSTGSDSTQIRFRVTATLNCSSLLCNNTINNRFWIYGAGQTSGDLLNSGSNPILVDSHGCPIPGTTKTIINASACSGPTITNNSPVCAGESINLNVSTVVGATSYIWTGPNGYYSNVQNTIITNSTVAMSGTYTVTVYSNPGCAYSLTTNVIVNAAPDVNSVSNQIVCNNGSTTPIAYSGSIAGTSYNWTNSNTAIGLAASGSGNIASFTALNSGSSPVISTISVIPTLSGCIAGSSASFSITVNPTPTASASSTSQNICSGSAPSINLSSNVSGTTFNWAVVQSGVTGASAGSGSLIGQTLSTTSNVAGTAVYAITPTSNNCNGSPIIVTINVKPLPILTTSVASLSLCSGTTASISFTSNVLGAGFDWTVVQTGVSGATYGTGASINQTLSTNGSNSGTAIYTITPSASNCVGSSVSETITVNPIPVGVASPSSQIICSGSPNTITLSSDVTGASFAWTVSQSGVSGASNGNGSSISQTLSTIGTSLGTAQYTITPTANNCVGSSFTASSTVNPIPNVTATPTTQTICSGTAPAISLSSSVTGTSFTWTVLQNGVTGATRSEEVV